MLHGTGTRIGYDMIHKFDNFIKKKKDMGTVIYIK